MKRMLDFYFAMHYVLYRYYRRKGFGEERALNWTCSFQSCLSVLFMMGVIFLPCKLLNISIAFGKPLGIIYLCVFWTVEYFLFYRNGAYIDVFLEYDRLRNTPAMKKKCRYAKVFNVCVIVFGLTCLYIADYINHH